MGLATREGAARITYGDPAWQIVDAELANGNFVAPMLLEGMDTDSQIY